MIECWNEKRTCPHCKTKMVVECEDQATGKMLVECEDQATGFRQMSYLICPRCKKEIDHSMSVDYLGIEVEK